MKLLKLLTILITLTIFSSVAYSENCSDIKMDSSVNIIKKLKCKASGSDETKIEQNESTSTSVEDSGKKKKGILSKLFKKPTWAK
jgi:hypothetical protein